MHNFSYYIPTKVIFGLGKLEELATMSLPGKKALLCTTPERLFIKRVTELLEQSGIKTVLYDEVRPNPSSAGVMKAAALGNAEGCDFVIGVGGGSSIDTAKATAVVMKNGGDVWDYMGGITGTLKPIANGALPIVAISTTSGTGTEVNPFAVISKDESIEKIDLASEALYPAITIIDPCLQVSLPKSLTAFQGMDVIFHSAEGYIANCATPISDAYALESIRLAAKYLLTAFQQGDNMEARERMCLANLFAGLNESTSSCVSEHAIAHSFGAIHAGIPHGAALCLVCIECFKYYADYVPERMAEMSRLVGYGHRAQGFVDFLSDMLKKLGIDSIDYRVYGLDPTRAEEYAKNSYDATQCLHDCDVHSMPIADCIGIIKRSLK